MEKYGFVYIWYDRKHKRYYVGAHWGDINDGYICSSPWMLKAYKRRPKDFKRRIIAKIYTNRKDTFLLEEKYLQLIKPDEIKIRYYNLNTKVSDYWYNYEDARLSVGEKISKSRTGKKYSKRRSRTEEEKKKISETTKLAMKIYFDKPESRKFGKDNSQFGTMWVTDGDNSIKIKKEAFDEYVDKGFYKGRVIGKRKNKH